MRADLKKKLYELLTKIPFGPQQRELIEKNIEEGDDAWAEKVLAAFEKAEKSAVRALKAAERYRLARKKKE